MTLQPHGMTTSKASDRVILITPRQYDIISLIHEGLTLKSIAEELGLAVTTISTNMNEIYWRSNLTRSINKRQKICRLFQEGNLVVKNNSKKIGG